MFAPHGPSARQQRIEPSGAIGRAARSRSRRSAAPLLAKRAAYRRCRSLAAEERSPVRVEVRKDGGHVDGARLHAHQPCVPESSGDGSGRQTGSGDPRPARRHARPARPPPPRSDGLAASARHSPRRTPPPQPPAVRRALISASAAAGSGTKFSTSPETDCIAGTGIAWQGLHCPQRSWHADLVPGPARRSDRRR